MTFCDYLYHNKNGRVRVKHAFKLCSVNMWLMGKEGEAWGTWPFFFRIPKDATARAAWVHRCARLDTFNPDTAAVCSRHFLDEDYDPAYYVKKSLMTGIRPWTESPDRVRLGCTGCTLLARPHASCCLACELLHAVTVFTLGRGAQLGMDAESPSAVNRCLLP